MSEEYGVTILGRGKTMWGALRDAEHKLRGLMDELAGVAADSGDPPPAPREEERRGPTAGVSSEKGGDTE